MKIYHISHVMAIFALIGGTASCGTAPPTLTPTSTSLNAKTLHLTTSNIPTIEPSPSKTISPLPIKTIDPAEGIDVIVYTWDEPMRAKIPPIHIWKNGRALWVIYGQDKLTHVYETYLSPDEIVKVKSIFLTSGFWSESQPEASFTQASWLFLWASTSSQTGVVALTTSEIRDKFFTPLQNILESSPNKMEFFPAYGYLFVSDYGKHNAFTSGDTFFWLDDKVRYEFTPSQGIYIDGEMLSGIWKATQRNTYLIASQNNTYRFELKIPGVSCVISIEPYMCNMYSVEEQ